MDMYEDEYEDEDEEDLEDDEETVWLYEDEYKQVLAQFCINNSVEYPSGVVIQSWNGFNMRHYGWWVNIWGKIPLEVEKIIQTKYPHYDYHQISFDGNPTDDQYEEEKNNIFELERKGRDTLPYWDKARKRLYERPDDNKYYKSCGIHIKRGFIIFLTELSEYYERKQRLFEINCRQPDEIMVPITAEILDEMNPNITSYDWMNRDELHRNLFFDTINKNNSTALGTLLRQAIDKFDNVINPYTNQDIELDDIENYLRKVQINVSSHNEEDGKERENCCRMIIEDREGKGRVEYSRNTNGFSYKLVYKLGENKTFKVTHFFNGLSCIETEKGEFISIEYYGEEIKLPVDLMFNNTLGLCGKTYRDKAPVTVEEFDFIYTELLKAIEYASQITIENMRKPGFSKKLVPNNEKL